MMRRGTPEADLQRAVVQALRIALPRSAIIHHCANEVTEGGPRGAKLRRAQGKMEEGGRLQGKSRGRRLQDQELQGHQGQLLRDLRRRQGRQESGDLLQPRNRR